MKHLHQQKRLRSILRLLNILSFLRLTDLHSAKAFLYVRTKRMHLQVLMSLCLTRSSEQQVIQLSLRNSWQAVRFQYFHLLMVIQLRLCHQLRIIRELRMVTRVLIQAEWVIFHHHLSTLRKLMSSVRNTFIRQLLMQWRVRADHLRELSSLDLCLLQRDQRFLSTMQDLVILRHRLFFLEWRMILLMYLRLVLMELLIRLTFSLKITHVYV